MRAIRIASLGLLGCLLPGARVDAQIDEDTLLVFQPHLTITGEAGDRTGAAVAWIGDVNGDGTPDFALGAPSFRLGAGRVSAYSGKDGQRLWEATGSPPNDALGFSVAGAGDVDGDGHPDVLVGAPGADPQSRVDAGSAYVYSGRDGTELWRFDGIRGANFLTFSVGEQLGVSVAGAGDVDGDGHDDLLLGAVHAGPGRRKMVYLFSGTDGRTIWESGSVQDQDLGYFVESAGDVNADGASDFVVGGASATVFSARDLSPVFELQLQPYEQLRQYNGSLACIGDVNRDGIADFAAATEVRFSWPRVLYTVLFSGENGEEILRLVPGQGSLEGYDGVGGASGAGDMDLDGVPDYFVGAFWGDTDHPNTVLVLSGKTGSVIRSLPDGSSGDIAGGVHLDGDFFPDVLVGDTVYVTRRALGSYGTGVPGSWRNVPALGTGGKIPRLGSTEFGIELTDTLAQAPCVIAGSFARAATPLAGMTLHGDFLTPGAFSTWSLLTDGIPGLTFGRATLPIPIPQDPTLLGLRTFWQAFVLDPGSPLPIGVSHTRGLEVHIVR